MRRLSFRLGLLFSGLLGIIVSTSSLLIIKSQECGFLQIGPSLLCGGYGAGYPLRFLQTDPDFPFSGISGIQDISLLLFCIDAVLWMIPLLLIFVLANYVLQQHIQGSAKRIWAVVLALLTPLWLQIMSALTEWINIPTPEGIKLVMNFFSSNLVFFLLQMISPDQAWNLARLFIIIVYITVIGFVAAIVSIPYTSQRRIRVLQYPLAAVASILVSWGLTRLAAEPSLSDIQSYPFRVDVMTIANTASASSGSQLSYQITFLRLPQANISYHIRYYVSDSIFLEGQRHLSQSLHIDSLKQIDNAIYQQTPQSGQSEQQFVADATTDGTIDLSPDSQPRYLFVMISEQDAGYSYAVPIPQP